MPVRTTPFALCLLPLLTACGEAGDRWPVRATLDDGQVLMGAVDTPVLLLEGGLGTIAIPWDDVGEVSPVEGDVLASSGGFVDVWLRNGSELTGRWADPKLAMELAVGGRDVAVDVPVDQLLRLQTQGGEVWPEGMAYRAHTTHGDDFLVDPSTTRLVLVNDMGRFEPLLMECASAAPVDEPTGPWRVELLTGTVLVGPLAEDSVLLDLPMGPREVTVPLETLVALNREDWGEATGGRHRDLVDRLLPARGRMASPAATPVMEMERSEYAQDSAWDPAPAEAAAPEPEIMAGTASTAMGAEGWFDASSLRQAKQALH